MFKAGVAPNPTGYSGNWQKFSKALKIALASDDNKRIRAMAEKLADRIADCDEWALEFAWSKLEKDKPAPNAGGVNVAFTLTVEPQRLSRIASDVELVASKRADGDIPRNGTDGFVLLAAPSPEASGSGK